MNRQKPQGNLPRSARHNQQPQPTNLDYSVKAAANVNLSGTNPTFFPQTHASNNQANLRKSSLNPATTVLQKSLGSIEFQQQKKQSTSLNRNTSDIRSRDKLPEIGLNTKIAMYN